MGNYEPVVKALAEGRDPAMLCTTCPWDRTCVTPPEVTRGDIQAKMAEAAAIDEQRFRETASPGFGIQRDDAMPVATLVTAMTWGGRDMAATICPVFALRLRSGSGRKIADNLKAGMQAWDDAS